jgi:integrase/recombinase XerC
LKAYGTYWNRVVKRWGERRLDEPSPLEIEQLGKQVRAERVQRRNGRDGSGAEENFVAAMRCLYRRAVANGLVTEASNPAARWPSRGGSKPSAGAARRPAD